MAFNLGDVLKNVSNSGTGREQITYLPIDSLDSDAGNFYELRDIDALADNISMVGLQQPIRVRAGKEPGRYTIVSGHRRITACRKLAEDEPEAWREVPCIIETDSASPALQQLRLIYANASTRQRTSAEISEEAQQVEKLLYELKKEGYDFPGRMRDHVAEAVGASKTKLARLKVIRENLVQDWARLWEKNKINESQAYALAKLPADLQQYIFSWTPENQRGALGEYGVSQRGAELKELPETRCNKTDSGVCDNLENMRMWIVKRNSWETACSGCCKDCLNRFDCKYVCPRLAEDLKKIKRERRAKQKAKERAEAATAKTKAAYMRKLWERFEAARQTTGIKYHDLVKSTGVSDMGPYREKYLAHPKDTELELYSPYGFAVSSNFTNLCSVADTLGVSVDYLLGRDVPEAGPSTGMWHTGEPEEAGEYIAMYNLYWGGDIIAGQIHWDDAGWCLYDVPMPDNGTVYLWTEVPEMISNG